MHKSIHEEHLFQPLHTNEKQFKVRVTFLSGYNGTFNVTNSSKKFCFAKSITNKDGCIQITIPPGAYKIESLIKEIERNFFEEGRFTEVYYPFTIKPKVLNLGSVIENSRLEPIFTFLPIDSIQDLFGVNATTLFEKYNPSHNLVDTLAFHNIILETDIAQGTIFKGRRSGIN